MRTAVRRGKNLRRLAGDDPTIKEGWNGDQGRWAFKYITAIDSLAQRMVRNADGEVVVASFP